jgi:hypothetical protein
MLENFQGRIWTFRAFIIETNSEDQACGTFLPVSVDFPHRRSVISGRYRHRPVFSCQWKSNIDETEKSLLCYACEFGRKSYRY